MGFLSEHPFAVKAHFKQSVVATFSAPVKELRHLVPAPLELDTLNGTHGFIAAAMVQTKHLRPAFLPKYMGNDFFLVGYRVFVTYTTSEGKRLRGLYILKSLTDKRKMKLLGNFFTHYNYSKIDVEQVVANNTYEVKSLLGGVHFKSNVDEGIEVRLPVESPFDNWQQARRFAGPLPFTFTVNQSNKTTTIVKGLRQNWKPKPIVIRVASFDFVNALGVPSLKLASGFSVSNIDYKWEKGKIDQWV